MGTHSIIAIGTNGKYESIYCHWDGYPEKPGVGWILNKHYKTTKKVKKLIGLGNLSSLGRNIGVKHNFSNYKLAKEKGYSTFYERDRGESNHKSLKHSSLNDLFHYTEDSNIKYLYIYNVKSNKWKYIKF